MPTPKQVRFHIKRLRYRWDQLQQALNKAHDAEVIVYLNENYREEGPCASSWELRKRILLTTEKARAQVVWDEADSE